MKKALPLLVIVLLCSLLSSCAAVEGIFKAGVWTGILAIVVVVALLIWILSKLFSGGNRS